MRSITRSDDWTIPSRGIYFLATVQVPNSSKGFRPTHFPRSEIGDGSFFESVVIFIDLESSAD